MHQAEPVRKDRVPPFVGRLERPGHSNMLKTKTIHVNLSDENHLISTVQDTLLIFRKYEAAYFGLERLETSEIVEATGCQKPCRYRKIRNLKT